MPDPDKDYKRYYDILEIDSSASPEEVKTAYFHLKNLYSADSLFTPSIHGEFSPGKREEILSEIDEAYKKLSELFPDPEAVIPDPTPIPTATYIIESNAPVSEYVIAPEPPEPIELDIVEDAHFHFAEDDTLPEELLIFDDELPGPDDSPVVSTDAEAPADASSPSETIETGDNDGTVEVVGNYQELEQEVSVESSHIDSVETNIGMGLTEARTSQGITLDDLWQASEIPYKTLEDIENENFAAFPEAGYLRWCVSVYAKNINLDAKETADEYMKRYRKWQKDNI